MIKEGDSILVIAYKYNDILFALGTEEFVNAKLKLLLIFALPTTSFSSFPYQNYFDQVFKISYVKGTRIFDVLSTHKKIKRVLKKTRVDTVTLSNPYMVYNEFVFSKVRAKEVVLLEDGLMNYGKKTYEFSLLKRLANILGIFNYKKVIGAVKSSYLLAPERATFFLGEKKKVQFSSFENKEDVDLGAVVNGKNVFIGQNLYTSEHKYCTEEEYYSLIRKAIIRFKMDIYIPHPYEPYIKQVSDIVQVINLSDYRRTLEAVASITTFNVFSFGSTVLFSSKRINPKIQTNLVRIKQYDILPLVKVLDECDNYFELE